jgi:hypothetical protein
VFVRLRARGTTTITDPDTFSDVVVSGNSAHDPFASHGNVQAPNYDAYAIIYGFYAVTRSRITVSVLPTAIVSTTGLRGYRLTVAPRNVSTAFSSITDMQSQAYAVSADMFFPGTMRSVRRQLGTAKFLGLQDVFQTVVTNSPTATITSNPAAEWFWHIACVDSVASTDSSVLLDIQIEMETVFFGRVGEGQDFFTRVAEYKLKKERYAKLKAMTPDRSGRVPPAPPEDKLETFVRSIAETKDDYVRVSPRLESKEADSAPQLVGHAPRSATLRSAVSTVLGLEKRKP